MDAYVHYYHLMLFWKYQPMQLDKKSFEDNVIA